MYTYSIINVHAYIHVHPLSLTCLILACYDGLLTHGFSSPAFSFFVQVVNDCNPLPQTINKCALER